MFNNPPGGGHLPSLRWSEESRQVSEGKKRGIVSELCDGRGIGLMCGRLPNSTSESALERNKSSLSIRYFKSIEERQEYAAEVKALRDSLREQAMKNSGFDKDSL
jgi:hypothetical protein